MRALAVAALLLLSAPALAQDGDADAGAEQKLPPLKVVVDRSTVDLDAHRLELKMSREAKSVKIRVLDEMGAEIAEEEHDFSGKPAGAALLVTWQPKNKEPVARIELFAYDTHGYWMGVALTPWSVQIPHQEVLFDTNKAIVKASEEPKLEESYDRINKAIEAHKEIGAIKLFVAGHTDTVGTPAHNLTLSRKRAQAIAKWFKKRGLSNPVLFAGFGESVLAVKTKDEVAEAKNRRVDYILAIEPPVLKSGSAAPWQPL